MRGLRWLSGIFQLLACAGALVGCRAETAIPPSTVEQILQDVIIANGVLAEDDALQANLRQGLLEPYDSIMLRHGVTRRDFDSTLRALLTQPQILDAMLERIITNLQIEQSQLEAEMQAPSQMDSLALQ